MAFGRNVRQDWDREPDWVERFYLQAKPIPAFQPARLYSDPASGITVVSQIGWKKVELTSDRRQMERLMELFRQLLEAQSTRIVLLIMIAAWFCAATGKVVRG